MANQEISKKLLKYFNGTTTFVANILSLFGVLPIIFVLYSKDLLVTLSINVLLNFDMHDLNGALFLKVLFLLLASLAPL